MSQDAQEFLLDGAVRCDFEIAEGDVLVGVHAQVGDGGVEGAGAEYAADQVVVQSHRARAFSSSQNPYLCSRDALFCSPKVLKSSSPREAKSHA